MEYLNGGDLSSLLSNLGTFSTAMCRQYSAEIGLALEFCHSQGIVHRDIKPDNILIDSKGHCKLTDFGCSTINLQALQRKKSIFKNKTKRAVSGTPDYIAPELLISGSSNDKSVDYWALGCCIYEFLKGIPPFHASSPDLIFDNILSHRIDLEGLEDATNLINGLLRVSSKDRFTIKEMKSDVFYAVFQGDWSNIRDLQPPFIPQLEQEEDVDYFEARNEMTGPITMDIEELMKEKVIDDEVFQQFAFKNVKQLKELNTDSNIDE
eukprot:NODE_398_length_8105_cov_1.375094.p2 type:complete len:265 gc:universal NODE_398_length_8105_cov_1.375094:7575-6781(-)